MELDNTNPALPVTIKKLVALDIAFHGARTILIEFIFSTGLCGLLGALGIIYFWRTPSHPLFGLIAGLAFLGVAANYAGLLPYTIYFLKNQDATPTITTELANKAYYAKKYMFASLLLVVPFGAFAVTISQAARRKA